MAPPNSDQSKLLIALTLIFAATIALAIVAAVMAHIWPPSDVCARRCAEP